MRWEQNRFQEKENRFSPQYISKASLHEGRGVSAIVFKDAATSQFWLIAVEKAHQEALRSGNPGVKGKNPKKDCLAV